MSLHNGLDTVSIITLGFFSKTYSSVSGAGNLANLFASLGFMEDAPNESPPPPTIWGKFRDWFFEIFR